MINTGLARRIIFTEIQERALSLFRMMQQPAGNVAAPVELTGFPLFRQRKMSDANPLVPGRPELQFVEEAPKAFLDGAGEKVPGVLITDQPGTDGAKTDADILYAAGVAAWTVRVASAISTKIVVFSRSRKARIEKQASSASANLNVVVNADNEATRVAVAQYGFAVVAVEAESRRISRTLIGFWALLFLVVYSLPVVILAFLGEAVPHLAIPSSGLDDFVTLFAVTTVSCLIGLYPFIRLSRSQRSRLRFPVFTQFTTVASATAGVMLWDTHLVIAIGLLQASISMIVVLLVRANRELLNKRLRANLEARFPDILLLSELTAVWHDLQNSASWLNIDTRAAFGIRLQKLEKLVSRNFWRVLAPNSGHRKTWARERGEEIAKRLRDLDKKVAWPGDGARVEVANEIRRICSCVVEAKLAELNTDVALEPPLLLPVRAMMSHVLLAVLPLASVIVCKRAGLPLPDKVESWVNLGALLWAIVVLLGVFHPLVEKHLPNLRTTLQYFKGKAE